MDAAAFGAEALHCFDGGFGNAPESAAPPGVCSAYRRARLGSNSNNGAQSAASTPSAMPGTRVTMPSAAGASPRLPRLFDAHHPGAVDLAAGHQSIGRQPQHLHRDSPVLLDAVGIVAGAETAIQRGIVPIADPALPGEEGVAEATEAIKSGQPDHPIGSRSSNPGGAGNPREANAITLNKSPICSGSSKRSRPLSSRVCCSGEARAHSAARRARAPNARRKRPCGTGPWISTPVTLAASAKAAKSTSALRSALPGAVSGSAGL